MSPVETKIVRDEDKGTATLVVVIPGRPILEAQSSHPNWDKIVAEATSAKPSGDKIADLIDVSAAAAKKFERLSERITVAYGHVFFDGTEVDNSLAKQISRFIQAGEDFMPLVRFYEKIETNPNEHSREQLFDWLNSHDFTIDEDGDIRGYKGVKQTAPGEFKSINSGKAIVDNEVVNGQVPQKVGSVVEMPRHEVNESPRVACSAGLHIATHSYAKSWGDVVVEVKVNPRDICAVPEAEKVRSCRYTVVGLKDTPHQKPLVKVEPQKAPEPEVTDAAPTLDVTGKGTPVVKRKRVVADDPAVAKKYEGKRLWANRKTGRRWFETSKKLGVIRLIAADGSGDRQTQTASGIKKSYKLVETA